MRKTLSSNEIQDIIQQYSNGVTPKDIAQKYGIYNNSVTRLLKKQGIIRNQHTRISNQEIKFIIEQYISGVSSEVIAEQIDRDGSAVCRVLKRNGKGDFENAGSVYIFPVSTIELVTNSKTVSNFD